MPLAPIVPDYQGRSVVNVIPALTSTGRPGPLGDLTQALSGASAVVLVLLDGLGALQLSERSALAPVMAGAQMQPLTSVAPSTTAAALTSLTTGVAPGEHGIVGYRFRLGADTLQALRWSVNERDAMKAHPPDLIQRITPLLTRDGEGVPYVGDRKFAKSGFTRAHLRGATYVGISNVEELVASTVSSSQTSPFVIAYHDTIDKTAHSKGLEAHYDAALSEADGIVQQLRQQLPEDVALVVTSDHGQVEGNPRSVPLSRSTLMLVESMSGEGRFRWLHSVPGHRSDVFERVSEEAKESCWVLTKRDVLDAGWLGEVDDEISDRLGDVAVIPFTDLYVADPATPKEARMKSRHGSLTEAEMMVPLIVL